MSLVYLNGDYLPLEDARIPVLDRGFLFGDGVYEVIPAYHGKPLRLSAHLDRLDRSLDGIRLANPLTRDAWADIFTRLLAQGGKTNQAIYLQITRGAPASRDHRFPRATQPTVLVMTKPMPERDPAIAETGVSAILLEDPRWARCDIKSISLVAAVLLRQQAADDNAEEALLVRNDRVVEGSTSNVFLALGGTLITPPKGPELLAGITRDLVIELSAEAGLPVLEQAITPQDCRNADELWISSSTRELMPVTRLDGAPIGTGRPGPLWQRMDAAYQAYKARLTTQDHA